MLGVGCWPVVTRHRLIHAACRLMMIMLMHVWRIVRSWQMVPLIYLYQVSIAEIKYKDNCKFDSIILSNGAMHLHLPWIFTCTLRCHLYVDTSTRVSSLEMVMPGILFIIGTHLQSRIIPSRTGINVLSPYMMFLPENKSFICKAKTLSKGIKWYIWL